MIGIQGIEIFVSLALIISWFASDYKIIDLRVKIIIGFILIIALVLFTINTDNSIDPDFLGYLDHFNNLNNYNYYKEFSFKHLGSFSKIFSDSIIGLLIVYSAISIFIRYTAILKYAYNIPYSLCVLISNLFILHELIQIRAAVASALLLWLLPNVEKRNYLKAIMIIILAIYFHYSSIIFVCLLFLNGQSINKTRWLVLYLLFLSINICHINIYGLVGSIMSFIPGSIGSRIEWINYDILIDSEVSLYSRYILIPTLVTFGCLLFSDKLQKIYPYTIICIKCSLIGIIIFSLKIPVVSGRLFEMLSGTALIYICPLCLNWFSLRNGRIIGKIIISLVCVAYTWNLLYKQEVFGEF